MMRPLLLRLAGSGWLRERVPRLPFAQRAVRRFMPGDQPEDALRAAAGFQAEGIGTVFTRLGENVETVQDAEDTADHYLRFLDDIAARGLDGEISVKLTQLGFDFDVEGTRERVARLTRRAEQDGKTVWIDMESSAYAEPTIALYERLKSDGQANVGICLQAYLRRTAADVRRLLPLEPAIRLVKGAYEEPLRVAYRARREVDANYVALAVSLLHARATGQRIRVALGTHDVELLEQAAAHASALGLGKDAFEIQMLYGIRADQQRRLARGGHAVRVLISYGEAWYPWYMRRLAERPANIAFALRQIVG